MALQTMPEQTENRPIAIATFALVQGLICALATKGNLNAGQLDELFDIALQSLA
jgi:hypothetical protein